MQQAENVVSYTLQRFVKFSALLMCDRPKQTSKQSRLKEAHATTSFAIRPRQISKNTQPSMQLPCPSLALSKHDQRRGLPQCRTLAEHPWLIIDKCVSSTCIELDMHSSNFVIPQISKCSRQAVPSKRPAAAAAIPAHTGKANVPRGHSCCAKRDDRIRP